MTQTDETRRGGTAPLTDALTEAWRRGWQPADLDGYVRKHFDTFTASVLADALAAAVAQYAPRTIDERWHAQLEAIGATVWWSSDTDHLTARARRATGGPASVGASQQILDLALRGLPEIERLGPAPGSASGSRRATDVDQRMLARVRMLLAKAESTPYEAEADTFTSAAHSLMARHSIDRAVLEAETTDPDGPAATRLHTPAPYARQKFSLITAVAQANRCEAVWQEGLGFATVIGFEADLRAVELLVASLLIQAQAGVQRARPAWPGSSVATFRRSFLVGFTGRVAERLEQVTREETRAALEARALDRPAGGQTGPGAGTELVRVLADRAAAVDRSVSERFPRIRTFRSRASLDIDGWHSGRAAGDRAQLAEPRAIGQA